MFSEHIPDDSSELGPLTQDGWNIYCKLYKESKGQVADSHLRTDLDMPINHILDHSLLGKVSLKHTILCLLHALARIVETLLNLDIINTYSEAAKLKQTPRGNLDLLYLISNLEGNINIRGVRHGNFHILMEDCGKPKPVSLNKDHAFVIICPTPTGKEKEYPHIMHGVVPNPKVMPRSQMEKSIVRFFPSGKIIRFESSRPPYDSWPILC
jgi:hypothetical protein